MKKLLEQIGIRLYAFKYVPEYRTKSGVRIATFLIVILSMLCIYETVVY